MNTIEDIMRQRSQALVIALVGKDLADRWWSSANAAFEGQTPEDAWDASPDLVYSYLMRHASGGYL